jgi:integrase
VAELSLTLRDIEKKALPPVAGDRAEYRFKQCPGLVLRVTKSGTKTFYLIKRITGVKTPYREKLCEYPPGPDEKSQKQAIEDAKSKALEKLSTIRRMDFSPKEVERKDAQKRITFGELFEQYMEDYARKQTKTWEETEKNYQRYFKHTWDKKVVATIEPIDIQQWMNKLARNASRKKGSSGGTVTANRNYEILRAVIRWGAKMRACQLDHDPCASVKTFQKVSRERFLQQHEWKNFEKALRAEPNPIMRDFFWLCLFTGQRSGNVMSMQWEHINFDSKTWTIPSARKFNVPGESNKNNQGQVVNLTANALRVLSERQELSTSDEWVFPARTEKGRPGSRGHMTEPKGAWKQLLLRAGLHDEDPQKRLRIHDLRRTVGSYMAIHGVDTKTIGKVLGHKSATSTLVYARLTQSVAMDALENMQKILLETDSPKSKAKIASLKKTVKRRKQV